MISLTLRKTKLLLRAILFISLMMFFYFLFMKSALEKFMEGATTIVESTQKGSEPNYPVLIICPYPSFKPSFFKEHGLEGRGLEMYFWLLYPKYIRKLESNSTVYDTYMKMSYEFQKDWHIKIQNNFQLLDTNLFSSR